MTPEQVQLLFKAAQTPFITDEQRGKLTLANPFTMKGSVAEAIQAEVSKLDPMQAREWIAEAGAAMSLQAAAAAQGLTEMTPALRAEIDRLNPKTADEQKADRIAELTQSNPYGKAGFYEGDEYVPPVPPNITACLELETLNAELAAKLKAEAAPAKPAHNLTPNEVRIMQAHGYTLPE